MNKNVVIGLLGAIILVLCGLGVYVALNKINSRHEATGMSREPESPYIKNQVRNTIKKQVSEIQKCYKEFLKTKPKQFDGKIIMDWEIDPKGIALRPQVVEGDFRDPSLETCLIKTIKNCVFPQPPGTGNFYVNHKFFFKKTE